jgi:hypothetical protein
LGYTEARRGLSPAQKAWQTRRLKKGYIAKEGRLPVTEKEIEAFSLKHAQFTHLRQPTPEAMAYYVVGDKMVYGKEDDAPPGLLIHSTWQAEKIAKEKGLKME